MSCFRLLTLFCLGSRAFFLAAQPPAFSLEARSGNTCVVAQDPVGAAQSLSPAQEPALRVFVAMDGDAAPRDLPPVLGDCIREDSQWVFCPRFPFRPETRYRLFLGGRVLGEFAIPRAPDAVAPRLLAIYPSADTLPANLLKVYLHFATPMAQGRVYAHVRIVDEAGKALAEPFVHLEPALWDAEGRRLTLWLDPGRVKRALGRHEMLGPVLEAGRHYTLEVDAAWRDAQGQSLAAPFYKRFYVNEDDRRAPVPAAWSLDLPAAASRNPLRIGFAESLDQVLAAQCFLLWDERDMPVEGSAGLGVGERSWEFVPAQPWAAGKYRLRVEARLEDLAGNNLNRLFDRDLKRDAAAPGEQVYHWLEWELK